jgi:hypothetical protein
MQNLNFVEFVSRYQNKLKNNQLVKRPDPKSISLRIPQRFSSNPKNDSYYIFCKYQLLQYKPWSGKPSDVLDGATDERGSWINAWNSFLLSAEGVKKIPSWHKTLNKPKDPAAIAQIQEDQSEEEDELELQEDWMRLQSDTLFYTIQNEKDVDNVDYWMKDRLIKLGKRESPVGLTFVAFSRVRQLNDLLIDYQNFESASRLCNINLSEAVRDFDAETEELANMTDIFYAGIKNSI